MECASIGAFMVMGFDKAKPVRDYGKYTQCRKINPFSTSRFPGRCHV
jgi:hypothetical protein